MRYLVGLAMLCAAVPAMAQLDPRPVGSDARVQVVDYDADQVIRIQALQGYQVTLQFGSDERIENVAVGDSAAWQVTANHRGDLLFVKPIQDGIITNLTVATDARLYMFELTPPMGGETPYLIRFNYPAPAEETFAEPQSMAELAGRYRLSGAHALRPAGIGDDGVRTYISWAGDRPLPAVFTRDAQGREALVNGNMRGDLYVIDSVLPELLFRIDQRVARAVRVEPEARP